MTLTTRMIHLMMNLFRRKKDIRDGSIHFWHQQYSLPCNKVLGFVSYRIKSKVLGIGSAEHSRGDASTNKSGKRSAITSVVSDNQSIVYTCVCIESDRIEQYHDDKKN